MSVKEMADTRVNLQYQVIKLAWNQYQSSPESLAADELFRLERQAKVAQKIMAEVLSCEEAKNEQVKEQEIQFLLEELQQQFDSLGSFELSLKEQCLTKETLQQAIYQDLVCEKTLASQGQSYPKVSEQEALLYYEKNKARFSQPERRKASHILITINDEYSANERQNSLAKIRKLEGRLKENIADFPNLALQHSECPTSLNKGFIGDVIAGQLYPELDSVLFKMEVGCISSIIETEIGFHLLLCNEISGAGEMQKNNALKEITAQLNLHRQKKCEKKWLASLLS